MKKTTFLILAGLLALATNARDVHKNASQAATSRPVKQLNAPNEVPLVNVHAGPQHKGTAVIYSETFDGPGLPAGYATGIYAGPNGTWKWYANGQQSPATYHINPINTTTGFIIYDSDSIGDLVNTNVPSGWVKTAAFNCSGHPTVALKFDEYYRRFQDSCFVDVSTNDFSTWTRYPVTYNNNLQTNDYTATNPYNVFINISSAAANQSNVKLRFSYFGPPGGGYQWMIDNISVTDVDAHNVAMHNCFLYSNNVGEYNSSIGNVPYNFVDSIAPVALLDNYGANAEATVKVVAKIYRTAPNPAMVFADSVTGPVPFAAIDSIFEMSAYHPGNTINDTGTFLCAYAVTVTGNANVQNLVDTVRFSVTKDIWSQMQGNSIGGYFIHRPTAQNELSYYTGTRFDVPDGVTGSMTVQGISVGFQSTTTPGDTVMVQIYQLDNPATNGWLPKYATYKHALLASEISTTTQGVYCYIPMDNSQGAALLSTGTWAAVVTSVNAPATSTVTILASKQNPATPYSGFFGQVDTSYNDGSFQFGFQTQATGIPNVPWVRLHFAPELNVPGIGANLSIGNVYPNPANNEVNIPFTLSNNGNVNVSISNIAGQVINTRSMGTVRAKESKIATFSTAGLANGTYFFTIDVNGERTTSRFVVVH